MRYKRIVGIIAGVMIFSSTIPKEVAFADVQSDRARYEEYSKKIEKMEEEVQKYDDDVSELSVKIDENNKKLEDMQSQVCKSETEIANQNLEIKKSEKILGSRLRQSYKSNEDTEYLSVIFSSSNLGDLIRNLDSVKRVISADQDLIKNLKDKKKILDKKNRELKDKKNELYDLKCNLDGQRSDLSTKKASEESLLEATKAEKEKFDKEFLATSERALVKDLIAITNNYENSSEDITSAVEQLQAMRDNQIKSPTVRGEINDAIGVGKMNVRKAQEREEADRQRVLTSNRSTSELDDNSTRELIANTSGTVQDVLQIAYQQLGKPYVWGATGPNTFDCSGLTSYCYRLGAGVNIGRTTYDQVKIGKLVSVNELKPGDLVFPYSGHVQLYVGNGYVLHAPHTGDYVKISRLGNVWKAVRVINS